MFNIQNPPLNLVNIKDAAMIHKLSRCQSLDYMRQ